MMYDKIKEDRNSLRRNGGNRLCVNCLTTLVGELETKQKRTGEDVADADVINAIKKTIDGLLEIIDLKGHDSEASSEIQFLQDYLPRQLGEEDLKIIVDQIVNDLGLMGMKDMGEAMNALKVNYGGQFDGAVASKLVKKALTS